MSNEQFFTDVVKDVIGNDPVVDQFDIYYEASFYGTMQDDYITGSMLAINTKSKTFAVSTGGLGTRGRAFSVYYAESQPPLESTYGSAGVALNPFLSKRVVPWKERSSSTSYRLRQLFDGSERYYDSCIPDVAYCLGVDGSRIWTNSDPSSDVRTRTTLSPYASVITGSTVGYMLFNAVQQDRTSEGYEGDPTTNNDWTWSFPYEGKYRPTNRLTKFNSNLNLKSNLSARLPLYDKKEREFIGNATIGALPTNLTANPETTGKITGYFYRDSNSAITDSTPLNLADESLKNIEFFSPLLPGYNVSGVAESRNALRTKTTINGTLGDGTIRPSWYKSEITDLSYGHSLLVPNDVNFSRLSDNSFLSGYSNADASRTMPVTQSMSTDDQIKFLFGFGDVNTVTYGKRSYDSSKATLAYNLDLESYAEGTHPHQISAYDQDGLVINWNWDPVTMGLSDARYRNRWYVAEKINASPQTFTVGGVTKFYNYVSGSTSPVRGIGWEPASGSTKILVSNTSATSYHGTMADGDFCPLIVDITSSYPWSFSFDKAVAAFTQYGTLTGYFAAFPGQPTDWLTTMWGTGVFPLPGQPDASWATFLYVTGSVSSGATPVNTFVTMSLHDHTKDYWKIPYDGSGGEFRKPLGQYLLEPGEYRLVLNFGLDQVTTNPNCAAIDNFKIFTYKEEAFPVTNESRMGGNNYPKFKTYRLDKRINPVVSSSYENIAYMSTLSFGGLTDSDYIVSGSADVSKSIIFGISPEIRGWKYGLVSGFPTHSKAVFRRDKYGQFRDMLEQRPYTKFINVLSSPLDNDAITVDSFNVQVDSRSTAYAEGFTDVGPSVVAVNFVKQRYRKNDKGVGYIYNEKVDPLQTYSQNLSSEVTSSLPYFDGVAKHRQDEDLQLVSSAGLSSLQVNNSGLTVT